MQAPLIISLYPVVPEPRQATLLDRRCNRIPVPAPFSFNWLLFSLC